MKKFPLVLLLLVVVIGHVFAQTLPYQDSPFGFLSIPPSEFEYYNDLGIHWIVVGEFDWSIIERTAGQYDFSLIDQQLSNWTQHGLNLHYRVRPINSIYGTYWNESGNSDEYPDGHLDAWANFIEKFAERYDGDGVDDAPVTPKIVINSYQLVHELSGYKNYWLAHPDQYAEVFDTTYKALKRANPNAILYMPVPNLYLPSSQSEATFLDEVLSRLHGKGITDIGFDYHYWAMNPSTGWKTDGKKEYHWHAEYIKIIKDIAAKYGFNNSKIVSLESGMAGDEGTEPATELAQAGYVIRSYMTSLAHGQTRQFWTTITEYDHSSYSNDDLFAHTGLVNNPNNKDGLSYKKLAYYTYKKMVEILDGSDWNNIQTIQESDGIYIYKFTKQGKPIWVAWNDSSVSRTITISGINSNRVRTTEAVAKYESGKDVVDYTTAFRTDTLAVTNGAVMLTLGAPPVFVEPLELTSVEEEGKNIPQEFRLYQNYPNPFNPTTVISYQLPIDSHVTLKIYDVLGREVAAIVDESQKAGRYNVQLSTNVLRLSSGVYFYRLNADKFVSVKKFVILE